MATKKFAGPSPYSQTATYNKSDYVYTEYLNNITLNNGDKKLAAPVVSAIFGLGRAGSIHLASIVRNPRIILKYAVDDCTERFAALKAHWNLGDDVIFLTSKESDRVYKDQSVNVVYVCSSTPTHYNIIMNSINNNKDVFSEKPIAETIDEIKKCYEAAKAKGRILFSAFNRRFDPACLSLKNKVRQGEVGHVQVLKGTVRDSPLPPMEFLKHSGGIFRDCLSHDIDLACWILGELPIRVQATASAIIPEIKAIGDFDTVGFLLTFPSGAIALGDNCRYSTYGFDQRLEVFGNKGMIKVENERPTHSVETVIGQNGITVNPIYYSFPSRYKSAYAAELEHFLDVVQYDEPMTVMSWQTLAVSKIVTVVEKSARTGQTIELDWSKDDIPEEYS